MNKPLSPAAVAPTSIAPAYEADRHGWALHQAELLRAGRLDEVDATNVAEELIDVAGAEYDKLESALRVLLAHMLKWDHQPERRSRSWEATIREQRRRVQRVLRKNPSLKSAYGEVWIEAYEDARDLASGETNLPADVFPAACPYDRTDAEQRPFEFEAFAAPLR